MAETRIVTPGNVTTLFGFLSPIIGSIDNDDLKGSTLVITLEFGGAFSLGISSPADLDLIGQQILVGKTLYFLKDINFFNGTTWDWPLAFSGTDLEDAFNAGDDVTVIFDFRADQYTTPLLDPPYGNQGTLIGDSVSIDLNLNFTLANELEAANLPPGLSILNGVVTGVLTDNTGPFEVLVTATNSIGTTETTFIWNTYRTTTNTRIVTPGNIGSAFGFLTGLIGSMDDEFVKGVEITSIFEVSGVQTTISMISDVPINFLGDQILIGATTYFIKDATFFGDSWQWNAPFLGTDLEDAFNAATTVTVVFNNSNVNTIINSAINSDINTPISFPPHFDTR